MNIRTSWWIDNGFSLDEKLALRKKLAEYPSVTLEDSAGELVSALIPATELTTVIPVGIQVLGREKNCWIWISLAGDRNLVEQAKLSKLITQQANFAVYSFLDEGYKELTAEVYGKIKKKILANEIPVFCLSGIANLHDDTPKVFLDFLKPAFEKKVFLKINNPRFGYIIKKEITLDRKLQDSLEVSIDQEKDVIVVKLTASTPAALERAVNVAIKKAKAFKLDFFLS